MPRRPVFLHQIEVAEAAKPTASNWSAIRSISGSGSRNGKQSSKLPDTAIEIADQIRRWRVGSTWR